MLDNLNKFIKTHKAENEGIHRYFKVCIEDINRNNLYTLRRVCMYITLVYILMMSVALFAVPNFRLDWIHLMIIPLLLVYYFINRYIIRTSTVLSTNTVGIICCTFYFWLALIFIVMDNISFPETRALWTPYLVLTFPMLYTDRLTKYVMEELVMIVIFCILSYEHKDFSLFVKDFYAIFAAYVLSLLCAHIVLEVRSREGLAITELKRIGSLDKLTRVLNKDALLNNIRDYYERKKYGNACAMCVIDLDDFKHVNDNLGHNTGDLLLERVGQLLHDSFRSYDIIGRYGGDEFVVLMPDMADVSSLEMRCRTLQMLLVDFSLGNGQPFTVSIGGIIDKSSCDSAEIFRIADDALYMSKLSGKNCCTTWVIEDRGFSGKPVLVVFTKGDKAGTSKLYKEGSQHFDIISARTDKEALSYISQYHKNISIVFLEMDAIDDFEMVLRYIKTREGFANIPVLAVASSEENSKLAKELGADEVLLENSPEALYKKTIHKLIGM